jgi:hypothetical protein
MEPLKLDSELNPNTSKAETADQPDSSVGKKKRARAARHMQLIRGDRQNETKEGLEKLPKKQPSDLIELFNTKSGGSEKTKAEIENSATEIKEGASIEQEDAADLIVAAKVLAEARHKAISENSAEIGDNQALQLYAAIEDGQPINEAANTVQKNMGASAEDIASLESSIPSTLAAENEDDLSPLSGLLETNESSEFSDDILPEAGDSASTLSQEDVVEPGLPAYDELGTHPQSELWLRRSNESLRNDTNALTEESSSAWPSIGGRPPLPPFEHNGAATDNYGNPDNSRPRFIQSGNLNAPGGNEIYDVGNPAVAALVGYLIGRRRGRRKGIKQERKQRVKSERKLQKQIENVSWQLDAKEKQVRKLARDKQAESLAKGSTLSAIAMEAPLANRKVSTEMAYSSKAIGQVENSVNKQFSERRPAAEASQLHGAAITSERIGHMLIGAAELPLVASIDRGTEVKPLQDKPNESFNLNKLASEKLPKPVIERHAATLNRQELLSISEKIAVDGTSLRQIYETHLIGEQGLRRLVAEHLQGGNVKKMLRTELVEHEIDFERDPVMRDVGVSSDAASGTIDVQKTNFNDLVNAASASLGDTSPQVSYHKARADYQASERRQPNNRRRTVDVTLVTIIILLFVAVISLFASRH